MNKVNSINLYTDRLDLRIPTMKEQYRLWEILVDENINQYYFPTPDRIFIKNNLNKTNINDLKKAREIFMEQISDWNRQIPFYEKKIQSIQMQEDSQKFTWSIFLKDTNIVIGQITCQPKENEPENIRDVGWYIDPKYQGNGYASEAAVAVLDFMFNVVEITDIKTSAAEINPSSWKIMKKLGFEYVGTKQSSYFKDDEILILKEYHGTKELFLNRQNIKKKISLYVPNLEDYWYEAKLQSDPNTMSYNAGYNVSYYGYHYDTGCIDFPKSKWKETLERRIKENRFFAYIKDNELNEYVGYCNYHYNNNEDRYECGLVIESKYRGKGYSKEALKLLCDTAKVEGIKTLYDNFEIDRGNTLHLFKNVGFKIVEEQIWKKFGKEVKGVLVKIDL